MEAPKPVDSKTARQLFICGQILGIQMKLKNGQYVDPGALDAMLNQVDVVVLQKYLDSKPAGFRYADECWRVIKMVEDRKSNGGDGGIG
jgi:hypothetical protein